MRDTLALFLIPTLPQISLARIRTACEGGYKTPGVNDRIELYPQTNIPGSPLVGTLRTAHDTVEYSITPDATDLTFQVGLQGSPGLVIDEKVKELPAIHSRMISENVEIFFECALYDDQNPIEFCRHHSC